MKTMRIAAATALLACLATPAFAEGYAKFAGIKGTARNDGSGGWIQIESLQEGLQNPVAFQMGTTSGSSTSKSQSMGFVVTKAFDITSPDLRAAAASGAHYTDVTVDWGTARFVLTDVVITGVSTETTGAGLVEKIEFNGVATRWTYQSGDVTNTKMWNYATNSAK